MNSEEMRNEIKRILLSPDVEFAIKENEAFLFECIPELRAEKGFEQRSKWHCFDVWEHTIHAVKNSRSDADIRLILLLHDIGKPFSFQEDGSVRHFRGHAERSAQIAANVLKRLGYSADETEKICFFIGNHATTITADVLNDDNIDQYQTLLHIQYCDASAYAPEYARRIKEDLNGIRVILETYRSQNDE